MPEMSKSSCLSEVCTKGGAKLTLFTLPEFAAPPLLWVSLLLSLVALAESSWPTSLTLQSLAKCPWPPHRWKVLESFPFPTSLDLPPFVGLAALSRTIVCTAPWIVVPWSPFWTPIWLLISIAFSRIWALFTTGFGFLLTLSFVFALVERLAFAALLSLSFFNSIHIDRTCNVLRCRNWGTQRHRLRPAYGAGVKSQSWLPEFLIGCWILEGDLQIGLQLVAQALHKNGKTQFIS